MKLVITGAGGMLAQALAAVAAEQGHEAVLADRDLLDVTDEGAVQEFVARAAPGAVVQCAAYSQVDRAEREEEIAHAVNARGAANAARACARAGAWFVYPSTDYVFDGRSSRPYRPIDAPAPLNAYGRSKLAGESAARTAPQHLVVRTSWLYGAGGRNFVATILERARTGAELRIVNDQRGSPTWTRDLADTVIRLLDHAAPPGIYHACNRGATSWYELACTALNLARVSAIVTPISSAEYPRPAARPQYSVLDCTATEQLIGPLRGWREALAAAVAEGV